MTNQSHEDFRDELLRSRAARQSSSCKQRQLQPDGEILASASTDGTVILWSLNLDDLLARGCTWLKEYFVTHPAKLNKLTVCQRQ